MSDPKTQIAEVPRNDYGEPWQTAFLRVKRDADEIRAVAVRALDALDEIERLTSKDGIFMRSQKSLVATVALLRDQARAALADPLASRLREGQNG